MRKGFKPRYKACFQLNENLWATNKISKFNNNKWQGIQLLESTGKYKDIIYKYGKVKFGKKETAKGELPLTFHYDLIYSNDMSGKELQEDLRKS